MAAVYATEADWDGTAPDNAANLIRAAHALVRKATRGVVYAVDADGRATDTVKADAMRDAVLAQAAAWAAADIDPTSLTALSDEMVSSVSLGGGSVNFTSQGAAQERAQATRTLSPVAEDHLASAGLLTRSVMVYG